MSDDVGNGVSGTKEWKASDKAGHVVRVTESYDKCSKCGYEQSWGGVVDHVV